MKKNTCLILVLFLLSTLVSKAQLVTIQGTNQFPVVGSKITYTNANSFGFDALGVGPVTAKVWDFSGLTSTGALTDFEYVNPATLNATDGADKFPTATIARKETGATGYFYYKNTPTNIDRIGFYGATTNFGVYTGGTKATEFKFPFTAGNSYNSTYVGDFAPFNVGEDFVKITDGTLTMTADMQGQMILPTATFGTNITYTNVLRIHVVESFHIKTYFSGVVVQDNVIADDYFYWFVEGVKSPLFIYGITTQDGTAQPAVLRFQKTPGTVLNLEKKNIDTIASISPNPSNGIFNLKSLDSNFNNSKVTIYNNLGMVIYNSDLKNNSNEIDISKEPKGIYIVKIMNINGSQTQKIIKN